MVSPVFCTAHSRVLGFLVFLTLQYAIHRVQINPAMNGLSLEQNQIGDDGVAHIAEALRTETSLTFVNFQGNQARGGSPYRWRARMALRITKFEFSINDSC